MNKNTNSTLTGGCHKSNIFAILVNPSVSFNSTSTMTYGSADHVEGGGGVGGSHAITRGLHVTVFTDHG